MTLTIEQVRDCKFHLARRNGYEPVDVDNFVDKVEETLIALNEEIGTLKRQVGSGGTAAVSGEADDHYARLIADRDGEIERQRAEIAAFRQEADAQRGEAERLRSELAAAHSGESDDVSKLRAELEAKQAELARVQAELEAHRSHLDGLRGEIQSRDEQLSGLKRQLEDASTVVSSGDGKVERLVLTAAPEASSAVTRLLEMATTQADALVSGAQSEAERRLSEAQVHAERTRAEAEAHAQRVKAEAETLAERAKNEALGAATRTRNDAAAEAHRLTSEAQAKRERLEVEHSERKAVLDKEFADRRDQLIGTLESEHGQLAARVAHLRDYEKNFRDSFTAHLNSHIERIGKAELAPADEPELLKMGPVATHTPQLDKLLNPEEQ